MKLKEKHIVDYLCKNWEKYFPEFIGYKKEFTIRNSRVDILSTCPTDLYKLGIRSEDDNCRYINASVLIEVKYSNNQRDLLFELQKHIKFRDWLIEYGKSYCYIAIVLNELDNYIINFAKDNDILIYKYIIYDDDLSTFKIEKM